MVTQIILLLRVWLSLPRHAGFGSMFQEHTKLWHRVQDLSLLPDDVGHSGGEVFLQTVDEMGCQLFYAVAFVPLKHKTDSVSLVVTLLFATLSQADMSNTNAHTHKCMHTWTHTKTHSYVPVSSITDLICNVRYGDWFHILQSVVGFYFLHVQISEEKKCNNVTNLEENGQAYRLSNPRWLCSKKFKSAATSMSALITGRSHTH